MEQNSNSIIERTQPERRRVFRALIKIRIVLAKDVQEIFSGTVEVDETYVRGQWKNKRKSIRDHGTNGEEGPGNNGYLESSVVAARSGLMSLMTLKLTCFNQ